MEHVDTVRLATKARHSANSLGWALNIVRRISTIRACAINGNPWNPTHEGHAQEGREGLLSVQVSRGGVKNWDAPRYRKGNKFPTWKWRDKRRNAKVDKLAKVTKEPQEGKEEVDEVRDRQA